MLENKIGSFQRKLSKKVIGVYWPKNISGEDLYHRPKIIFTEYCHLKAKITLVRTPNTITTTFGITRIYNKSLADVLVIRCPAEVFSNLALIII